MEASGCRAVKASAIMSHIADSTRCEGTRGLAPGIESREQALPLGVCHAGHFAGDTLGRGPAVPVKYHFHGGGYTPAKVKVR